ncbi:MAG: hypothetical protein HQL95_01295 [Magnetococcales bacterium]|nr:hypothetical protein [Magnetococcales bacterium]
MEFIPLHYPEKLEILNPHGDVGLVTLWSPVKVVRDHLQRVGVDLTPDGSRLAVLGTLYGEGLPEMLRNLLYNPQIRHLVLFGVDLGRSRENLKGFFAHGLEPTVCLGVKVHQIKGTHQKIDDAIRPEDFAGTLQLEDCGKPGDPGGAERLRAWLEGLPPVQPATRERREVPLVRFEATRYPSDPKGHQILAQTPLDAWKEVIHRLYRFGHRVALPGKGDRLELHNVKVTIRAPAEESAQRLREHGFSPEDFQRYQQGILSAELPADQHYGYGNRLRGYFGAGERDALTKAARMLKENPESRHAFIALWDTSRDLMSDAPGHPCLVSLFPRVFEERLTLTALFRTHNALKAWLMNVHGLIAIQRLLATKSGLDSGALTLISHSLTIDPQGGGMERARTIHDFRNNEMMAGTGFQQDPHGDFVISVNGETGRIVVDHRYEGQLLTRYTGGSAEELERQIVRDQAISDIAHALYLGRELGRAETRLKSLKNALN